MPYSRALPDRVLVASGSNISETERILSGVLASALAVFAYRKRDTWSLLALFLSSEFFRRGITGHSYLYASLGISGHDFHLRAKDVRLERSITIRGDESSLRDFVEQNCLSTGQFEFEPILDGRATVVYLIKEVSSPEARREEARLRKALRDLKQIIEVGEVATTTGQPHGRREKAGLLHRFGL